MRKPNSPLHLARALLGCECLDRMKTIPLTRGKVALVDDEDFERLKRFKWQALLMKRKRGQLWYARRMTSMKDGPRRAVYMHREVMNAPNGVLVDHDDFDGLNNQRSNLVLCSAVENCRKRRKTTGTHSRFKGVTWNGTRWMASIKFGDKSYTLGYSHDEEEAALLFDVAAQVLFGEFAHLNGV